MKRALSLFPSVVLASLAALPVLAQDVYELPAISVYSEKVANQTPVATFAMPVSGLQFEPRVDVQARNFAEAQADIAIRGGIFENTGFKFGAFSVYDPQTGHYFAELPIAPAMLSSPRVLTGAENASSGFNAEVGTVAYEWSPITQRGEAAVAVGDYRTNRQDFYQGFVGAAGAGGYRVGADFNASRSESDGSVPFGDHDFRRLAGRVQVRGNHSQTDFFAGWQEKFFGWPNLYTPFGFNETEHLKTELYALNHRAWSSPENFWQLGAYYRRNYDDYEFNRAVPGASNPFQHTTYVRSLALDGRQGAGPWSVGFGAQYMRDSLQSTSLTYGRFHRRDYYKLSLLPRYEMDVAPGALSITAGATYDDTNRDKSALSPVLELSLRRSSGFRVYAQYAESTQVATYTALNSNPSAGLFRGNPHLGRETSRNVEIGTEFKAGAWTVQAAYFHRQDDDLVDWTYRRGVVARTANPVDITTNGVEVVGVARSRFGELVLGYTFLAKDPNYGATTIDASFYALNFARHRFTAALVARWGHGWEARMDNEYRVQEKNALRTAGGNDAFLSGLGLYYLPPDWPGLELSARIDNLWDSDFQEVPSVPAGRRQIAFGATYRW